MDILACMLAWIILAVSGVVIFFVVRTDIRRRDKLSVEELRAEYDPW